MVEKSLATMNKFESIHRSRKFLGGVVACLLLSLTVLWWAWVDTPQLALDEEVLKTVDSLFTAVTARRQPSLIECEKRLIALHVAGRISDPAWNKLNSFIQSAKKEDWEIASRQLYRFIELQRGAG